MRVSICIPTYNRAVELDTLLASITAQGNDHGLQIEVAISDNDSTDNTVEVVEQYKAAGLAIIYHRLPENQGFDRNLVNAVAIATGDYAWLFGSDDRVEPGAFARLADTLGRYPDVAGLSVGLQAYTATLSGKVNDSNQVMNLFSSETTLEGRDEIIGTACTLFGFISSNIVRRETWARVAAEQSLEPYHKGYIHLYLIARMLDARSRWVCVPQRMVGYRTGNDSFKPGDEFSRTRLDIVGYDLAFGDVLGRNSPTYRTAMAKVAVICVGGFFLNAKLEGVSTAYWREAIPTSVSHYWRYPAFWLRTLPVALVPRFAFLAARRLYRQTLKPLRTQTRPKP
jgi:abequosyltransferase